MKQFSTVVNTALTCTLIFLLISIGLPNFNVHASTPTPSSPPPAEQSVQSVCDSTRIIQVSGTAVVNVKPDTGSQRQHRQTERQRGSDRTELF